MKALGEACCRTRLKGVNPLDEVVLLLHCTDKELARKASDIFLKFRRDIKYFEYVLDRIVPLNNLSADGRSQFYRIQKIYMGTKKLVPYFIVNAKDMDEIYYSDGESINIPPDIKLKSYIYKNLKTNKNAQK